MVGRGMKLSDVKRWWTRVREEERDAGIAGG